MRKLSAVILAAGEGQRMKSSKAKVLHEICGKPIISYVLDTVIESGINNRISVVGHKAEDVIEHIGDKAKHVIQEKRLGTAHAVMQVKAELHDNNKHVIILNGGMPLIKPETIKNIIDYHIESNNAVTVVAGIFENPVDYDRIIRDEDKKIIKVVKCNNVTEEEKKIKEINSGIYCFKAEELFNVLDMADRDGFQDNCDLTDIINKLIEDNHKISTYIVDDYRELLDINDRIQLSEAESIVRNRILQYHMKNGVTIIDPSGTYIQNNVIIGEDTIVYPGTFINSGTVIGKDCIIGPGSRIVNSTIKDNVTVQNSVVLDSSIDENTKVGPFAYIRPESNIGKNVKIGDFVEIKKSQIGDGTKISHLSYVGDAELGKNVNMGCGSIVVNYDGQKKYKTIVGDNCFVGCNVNLVSPVVVNKNSFIAAGSTITDEVPEDALAIARSRQITKEGWVKKRRSKS